MTIPDNNRVDINEDQPKEEESKQCRICLAGPEDEVTSGRLIKPCLCKGSMRYVHVKCLNQWRMSTGTSSAFYKCNTCHYSYAFARTLAVGLATSPAVLGIASFVLFTFIVFFASSVIILFIPSLATPSYSIKETSFQEFAVSPLNLANRIITYASRTYDYYTYNWYWGYTDASEVDDDWDVQPAHPVDAKDIGLLTYLIHRFLIGLSAVGSLSFVAWFCQMSLLGPFRFRTIRRNRQNRRDGVGSVTTILLIIFILVGVARVIRKVYLFNRSVAQRMLTTVEDVILEVN